MLKKLWHSGELENIKCSTLIKLNTVTQWNVCIPDWHNLSHFFHSLFTCLCWIICFLIQNYHKQKKKKWNQNNMVSAVQDFLHTLSWWRDRERDEGERKRSFLFSFERNVQQWQTTLHMWGTFIWGSNQHDFKLVKYAKLSFNVSWLVCLDFVVMIFLHEWMKLVL